MRLLAGHVVFFQAEDGIPDLVRSRGLGDGSKRQAPSCARQRTVGCGLRYPQAHTKPVAASAMPKLPNRLSSRKPCPAAKSRPQAECRTPFFLTTAATTLRATSSYAARRPSSHGKTCAASGRPLPRAVLTQSHLLLSMLSTLPSLLRGAGALRLSTDNVFALQKGHCTSSERHVLSHHLTV